MRRRGMWRDTNLVKDVLELVLREGRTLHVFHCAQLLGHTVSIFFANRLHLLAGKLLADSGIVAKIGLGAHDQAGDTGAVVVHLGEPLFAYVLKGGRRSDRKANEEDIRLRIRKRTKTIVILLTSSIKQSQSVGLIANPIAQRIRVSSRFRYLSTDAIAFVEPATLGCTNNAIGSVI